MKKNDIILAIILIIFVVVVSFAVYFKFNISENEESIILDLSTLETNINENTEFGETTMQDVDKSTLSETFDIEEDKVEEVIRKNTANKCSLQYVCDSQDYI